MSVSNHPPLTILYVHSSDEMYGADLILLQLIDGLDRKQFRPIVVLPNDVPYEGLLTAALRERGIITFHMKTAILRRKYFTVIGLFIYLFRFFLSLFLLIRIIWREQVTLVHSNTLGVIPGVFAAWLTKRPHVWHVHEIIEKPRALWKLTAWLVAHFTTRAVCVSHATRDHLVAGHDRNKDKTVVIHNGIQTAPFQNQLDTAQAIREEWCIDPDHVLIGMVGRVSHWKGQGHFLHMAKQVAETSPQARFALVGGVFPGNEHLVDELKTLVQQLGLEDLTTLNDFRDDIPAVLHAYDIFILPSTSPDPFPTVVLEAMAAGRPIVANAHGGSVEMVEHGVTGFLVPSTDFEQMSLKVQILVQQVERRHEMGKHGRQRLDTYFSRDAFIQKWSDAYQNLIA